MRKLALLAPLTWACSTPAEQPVIDCLIVPPVNSVVIRPVSCAAELINGGNGLIGDWYVATPSYRAIFRHPLASLTMAGLQGGTLIDLAPWGVSDRLHEVIPVVDDGWIDIETFQALEETLVLQGRTMPWPDQPRGVDSKDVEIIWHFSATTSRLTVTGNEDLWIHPGSDTVWTGSQLISPSITLTTHFENVEDLGGVVLLKNAHNIDLRWNADPFISTSTITPITSGNAPNATHLEFLKGEQLIGRYILQDDAFSVNTPKGAEFVRAVRGHFQSSHLQAPGLNLTLSLNPTDAFDVTVEWQDTPPRPMRATWEDSLLGVQTELISPTGGSILLTDTVHSVSFTAGPHLKEIRVEIDEQTAVDRNILLTPEPLQPDPAYKWVHLNGISDRSKDWRGTSSTAFRAEILDGVDWSVIAPDFDVGHGDPFEKEKDLIKWRYGSQSHHPNGWSLLSWPWVDKQKLSGRGVSPIASLDAQDALASLEGGASAARFTAATPTWFDELGPAPSNASMPNYIWIDEAVHSTDPLLSLTSWFARLNQRDSIPPIGDHMWVPVRDPQLWSGADIEAGLLDGVGIASNGPLLGIHVYEHGPGELVTLPRRPSGLFPNTPVDIQWAGPSAEVLYIVSDGHIANTLEGPIETGHYTLSIPTPKNWLIAIAFSEQEGPWAVTGPIWFTAPE